jgi:cell division protease FtsH
MEPTRILRDATPHEGESMQKGSSFLKGLMVWGLSIILIIVAIKFAGGPSDREKQIQYSDFLTQLEKSDAPDQSIIKINLRSDPLQGDEVVATLKNNTTLAFYLPPIDFVRNEFLAKLNDKKIPVSFERQDNSRGWASYALNLLPIILVVVFMFFLLRNMQGAGGKALSFGKSKAKLMPENSSKVTFKDVAGVEEAKEECAEIISFLKDHKRFQEIGARIPKGVLMMGPPGTGKTLLARAIAGEAGVPFFHISGSDFVEMFVGVGASRVRDLFENAKKNAPCIVFIDEIDAVGRHRGTGVGGGHDEREQTLNQLLVEMDGFEGNEAIIVVAATNRPDVLDPALLRPGRFDRRVTVNLPDVRGRKEIVEVYLKKVKVSEDVEAERIALGTPGFAGADLENLVNEAALMAARTGAKVITMKDLEGAKDKILMGPERKSMVMSRETLTMTAYHETGHALVAYYLKSRSNVHKFSIIPRGRALGVTVYLPKEDIYSSSKDDLLIEIAKAMGGRAAEEIKFSQHTTGASDDIRRATEIARAMVCQYGMSKLGPINFGQKHENPFLGRDWGEARTYSDSVAHEIDQEVAQIANTQYELAKQILVDHMDTFEHISQVLLALETMDSEEFLAAVNGATIDDVREMQARKIKGHKDNSKDNSKDTANVQPEAVTESSAVPETSPA